MVSARTTASHLLLVNSGRPIGRARPALRRDSTSPRAARRRPEPLDASAMTTAETTSARNRSARSGSVVMIDSCGAYIRADVGERLFEIVDEPHRHVQLMCSVAESASVAGTAPGTRARTASSGWMSRRRSMSAAATSGTRRGRRRAGRARSRRRWEVRTLHLASTTMSRVHPAAPTNRARYARRLRRSRSWGPTTASRPSRSAQHLPAVRYRSLRAPG